MLHPFANVVNLSFYSAVSLSSIADAANAIERLYGVFEAELLEETLVVDENSDYALEVKNASWSWDASLEQTDDKRKKPMQPRDDHRSARKDQSFNEKPAEKVPEKAIDKENMFKVRDISLKIPRGKLVAIVGPVGSGKSSLLQGLISEMRKTRGSVIFGAPVSYCPQSAWIQVCFISLARCRSLSSDRTRLFEIIFASVVHSTRRDIGKPLKIRV